MGEAGVRGVFWVIEGELLAVPFNEEAKVGIAKSGKNYNHRLLWEHVRPKGCRKPFDYFPRGRVEKNTRGDSIIYMSPYVPEEMLPDIIHAFELSGETKIRYDNSRHYKNYMVDDRK